MRGGEGKRGSPGARPNQDARLDATDCRGELQVPTSRPPARLPAGAEFLPLQGLEHSSGQRAATRDQSVSTRSGWWNERSGYWPIERRAEQSGQGACFCLDYLSARQPSVFWPAEQTVEWTALLQWAAVTQPASVLYSGNASMRPDSVHLIQENVFICCCLGWGGVIGAAGMGGKEARRTGGRDADSVPPSAQRYCIRVHPHHNLCHVCPLPDNISSPFTHVQSPFLEETFRWTTEVSGAKWGGGQRAEAFGVQYSTIGSAVHVTFLH